MARADLSDWVPYEPEIVAEPPAPPTRRARRLLIPAVGDAFFIYGEYDDGNGMWIITGVSPAYPQT